MAVINTYEAQRRYVENQKKRGVVRVNTFVPSAYADELKRIAEQMRSGKWQASAR